MQNLKKGNVYETKELLIDRYIEENMLKLNGKSPKKKGFKIESDI